MPKCDEIEINLFGGGSAYGESILIHLGHKQWLVVDSIKNPKTNTSVILEYFNKIGEDPENIELVVATHWHDDHIKGISDVFLESKANLSISQAISKSYMTKLISLDEFKESENSGLREFSNVIKTSISLKSTILRSVQDRVLLETNKNGYKVKITALSPSDRSIEVFEQELSEILNDAYNLNLTCKKNNPNNSSIVLLIQIGNTKIILGSDLECTPDPNMGWEQVCKTSSIPLDKSVQIFKIPHHGSSNGDYNKMWNGVLSHNVIGILTPYGRGRKKLPSKNDKKRLIEKTKKSYITSRNLSSNKGKKRDPKVNKILNELSYTVRERKYEYGHVQLRKSIFTSNDLDWEVNLFGNACNLTDLDYN